MTRKWRAITIGPNTPLDVLNSNLIALNAAKTQWQNTHGVPPTVVADAVKHIDAGIERISGLLRDRLGVTPAGPNPATPPGADPTLARGGTKAALLRETAKDGRKAILAPLDKVRDRASLDAAEYRDPDEARIAEHVADLTEAQRAINNLIQKLWGIYHG